MSSENIYLQKPKNSINKGKFPLQYSKEIFSEKKQDLSSEFFNKKTLKQTLKLKPSTSILDQIEIRDKLIDGIFNKNHNLLVPNIVPNYMENVD